jgi:FlaA1/EpsC-like NDP-sugar epimerase
LVDNSQQPDWTAFLGRTSVAVDAALAESAVRDRSVLITGAGGSIGSGLALASLRGRPRELLLLDLSEGALYECYRSVLASPTLGDSKVIPFVGSIADRRLLEHLFRIHPVDLILHTAAYKHVPLMERNPFSALANNSIGTYRLVAAALENNVSGFVLLSTDKAVNPCNIMGVSKRIAEQVSLSHATKRNLMNAVRLGNVLGSAGSVAPIFQEQVGQRRALTVTHPDVSRYFLTQSEAEVSILGAATSSESGKIFVADCGEPIRIVELAKFVAGRDAKIEFIGLRHGDKLHESLIGEDERVVVERFRAMRLVDSPSAGIAKIEHAMKRLKSSIDTFSYAEMIAAVQELVPTYMPALDRADAIVAGSR